MSVAPAIAKPQCEAELAAASLQHNARLAHSVSLSGNRALLGAPHQGAGSTGAAVVLVDSGQGWVVEQQLQSIQPMGVEMFGSAVHLVGDEAWIGAPRGSVGGIRMGYVDRFERLSGTWTQVERIACPDPQSGGFFGEALVRDGERLVVGAPQAFTGVSSQSGKAYAFERVSGAWTLMAHIAPPPGVNIRAFGAALALDGELLVIGAPETGGAVSGSQFRAGAAFVYEHGAGGWQLVDSVHGTPGSTERVGAAVALGTIGSLPLAAIGAPFTAADAGSVLLRAPTAGGAWGALGTPLVPSPAFGTPRSGQALVFDGERLVVGAPDLSSGFFSGSEGGAVTYSPLIPGDPGSYALDGLLVSATGVGGDALGQSVSCDAGRVLLGAPQAGVSGNAPGRALLFVSPAAPRIVCQGLVNVSGARATLEFGGATSVRQNEAWFDASGLPSPTFCLGIYGRSAAPFPLGGGLLCLDLAPPGPTRFTPPIAVGAAGVAHLALDFPSLPYLTTILGNSTWTFQCWYRDANSLGSNLSDALEVSFCP